MRETIDAVYENGILRPLKPLPWLSENDAVRITIVAQDLPIGPLSECVGTFPDEDAEEMRQIIADEFEEVNPDEWR